MKMFQKYIACSYAYKLVCVENNWINPSNSYVGEDAVSDFINSIVNESKYWSDVMKKTFSQKTCKD